jgi:hypothetical protein
MSDDRKRPEIEIYRPNDALPSQGLDARLPHPEALLPPGFPTSGFFRLLRLGSAMRISGRYAAALDALNAAYRAAAGVHAAQAGVYDAQLELSRAAARLRDVKTILERDKDARDEERFRAAAQKFRAELDMYRAKAALAEYKNRDASDPVTPGNAFANDVETILKRALGGDDAA